VVKKLVSRTSEMKAENRLTISFSDSGCQSKEGKNEPFCQKGVRPSQANSDLASRQGLEGSGGEKQGGCWLGKEVCREGKYPGLRGQLPSSVEARCSRKGTEHDGRGGRQKTIRHVSVLGNKKVGQWERESQTS